MSEEKPFSDRILILAEKSEPFELTKEDVELYANHIGISLPEEEDLTWLAEEGLQAPLPPHWLPLEDQRGRLFYYNLETDESTWEHPFDGIYRSLVEQERQSRASSLADAPPLNSSQGSSKSSGELSEEVGVLPNQSLTTDDMTNFRKSARTSPARSVRFDLEQEDQMGGSTFDDFLEAMDASRLTPVLQKSPEPEDVNMLLQLAPRRKISEDATTSLLSTTKASIQDKRERFLKPMEPLEPFVAKPMKKVEVVLVNPNLDLEDVQTSVALVNPEDTQREESFEKPKLLKMEDRQESTEAEVMQEKSRHEDSLERQMLDAEEELTALRSQHDRELKEAMNKFEVEMMELNTQQSKDLQEMKTQLETEIQAEKSRHEYGVHFSSKGSFCCGYRCPDYVM